MPENWGFRIYRFGFTVALRILRPSVAASEQNYGNRDKMLLFDHGIKPTLFKVCLLLKIQTQRYNSCTFGIPIFIPFTELGDVWREIHDMNLNRQILNFSTFHPLFNPEALFWIWKSNYFLIFYTFKIFLFELHWRANLSQNKRPCYLSIMS